MDGGRILKLTTAQFATLTALHGRAGSATNAALRLVLVDGLTQLEASNRVGIAPPVLNRSYHKAIKTIELAKQLA